MRRTIIILAIVFASLVVCAQQPKTIESLNAEIARVEKEIALNEKLLKEIGQNKSVNQKQIKLLQSKINQRKKLVESLDGQIDLIDKDITSKSKDIDSLNTEIKNLKQEYGKMVYAAYKNHKLNNSLTFLFASKDYNDATKRLDYMRRYNRMRENNIKAIDSLTVRLNNENTELNRQMQSLDKTRSSREKELKTLQGDQSQFAADNKKLQQQETKISKTIRDKQAEKQRAEQQIQRIIAEEARKNSTSVSDATRKNNVALSSVFDQNKGKLPYPITGGVIVDHFGVHQHPTQKNLQINNKGVNIAGSRGAKVQAVFDGEVSRVVPIKGLNTCVMVRHGNYFSVYSNLTSVSVRQGDKVKTNQVLGSLSSGDDSDEYTLHFELWNGTTNLNPEPWLRR